LTQIVFNILENAVKYFPRERPASEFSAVINFEKIRSDFFIHFEDNGIGIGDEEISSIFRYATRGRDSTQSHVQGSGIGLWMCREIAHRLGGDLTLSSARSPTRFTLRLNFVDTLRQGSSRGFGQA
jgi:signal transduction histidine kinase